MYMFTKKLSAPVGCENIAFIGVTYVGLYKNM